MFFLSHVGITVAVVAAAEVAGRHGLASSSRPLNASSLGGCLAASGSLKVPRSARVVTQRDWRALLETIDYRLILVGSILPDVDKVIGLELFQRFDRNIFHTLLCLLLLVAVGAWMFRRSGDSRGLQLVFCWVVHLTLDQMWLKPSVLLWPLRSIPSGGNFGMSEFEAYAVHSLTTDPSQFMPELLGLAIVSWIAWRVIGRQQVLAFLKTGRIFRAKLPAARVAER